MDCSKSDPNSSLYKGGKWARTMSGYIALKAVSFSVCLLHSARSVDTLHINCGEKGDRRFRFTPRQGHGAMVVEKHPAPQCIPSRTGVDRLVHFETSAQAKKKKKGAPDTSYGADELPLLPLLKKHLVKRYEGLPLCTACTLNQRKWLMVGR